MVSVIIPAYNYGRYLAACLDSVKNQSYSDFECLIIDNGSTDDTAQVVSAYLKDPRFKYIRQENLGVSAARNKGMALASGQYIQFLDADDLLNPEKLRLSVEFLDTHPESGLVYGGMRYFRDGSPGELFRSWNCDPANDPDWMKPFSGRGKELGHLFLQGNNMVISSPLFRRALIETSGPFDEALRHNEDWEFWLRLVFTGTSFNYISDEGAFSLVRIHKSSASADYFAMLPGGLLVLEKHLRNFKALGLGNETQARIREHLRWIRSGLLESGGPVFHSRVQMLRDKGLYQRFFSRDFKSAFFAKLLLRFRTV